MRSVFLRLFYLLSGCLFLFALPASAQFSLSGEIRPRAEFRNGFKTMLPRESEPAFFTEQRSRLYAAYEHEKIRLGITLQDVRIWGSVSQVYKTDPSLTNLAEAWGEYLFNDRFSVRLGRQFLAYDNDRILGSLDWAQQGRSHDLALLKYADSTWQLHVGAAFNQDANIPEPVRLASTYYSGVNNYKTMQFAWFHKKLSEAEVSLLFLNNGLQAGPDSASTVFFSQTAGGIASKKIGTFQLQAEFYHQFGKNGAGLPVNAQLAAANISFPLRKVKLILGTDYLSGTGADEAGTDRSFTPFYGTNHAFYGLMDYFYVGSPHAQQGRTTGLIDIYAKPAVKLSSKTTLISAVHQFLSPVNIYPFPDPEKPISEQEGRANLGTELDFVLNVNLHADVNLKIGYSQLFATESLRAIKGGGDSSLNNWAWLMMTFKPKIL